MQKWEYLYVVVYVHDVITVNGEEVGKAQGLLSMPKGEKVWEFLKRVGTEGWILVTDTPIDESTKYRVITLRRSLGE